MHINHISVSRKKCHDTCEQQYKFRYHLKVQRPGPEPVYFAYGSIVHRIAELYVENKGKTNLGDLAQGVLRGKIDLDDEGRKAPTLPDEYLKKLNKHLRAIQNLTDKIGTEGIVEHPFYYDIDPPNGVFIKGFIDRLILTGDKAFIIDYKTTKKGKWRVNKETVKHDLQLRVYCRIVQKEFGIKPENIKAALYYLEGENLIACQYSEESLMAAEKEMITAFKRIQDADADKVWGKVGWHCKHCDYGNMCPFYTPQSDKEASWDGDLTNLGHDSGWG